METELKQNSVVSYDYTLIPEDFPRAVHHGAVPGSQMKLLVVKFNNKFYVPGDTPPERYERWQNCEDLAQQFMIKSIESKADKRAHMTEVEILDQYLERLLLAGWMSKEDTMWALKRTAQMLNWPVPQKITAFFS